MPGKVLLPIRLDRVGEKLVTHKRHEQSGFTPKKSIVDRILALRVFTERLRDFHVGLLAAYMNLRKAFDSVNRDVLWRILALRGVAAKLVNMISGLYSCRVIYGVVASHTSLLVLGKVRDVYLPQHTSTLAWTM